MFVLAFMAVMASAQPQSIVSQPDEPMDDRDGKSLVNTFPFNDQPSDGSHGHGHHHQPPPPITTPPPDLSKDAIQAAGKRCIDKVVMEYVTVYDEAVTCHHSYTKQCHTSYITDFEPAQEEECEETFTKNCQIEFKNVAHVEKVEKCHTPLHCDGDGPSEWKTVYESHCKTTHHAHNVTDHVPNCRTEYEDKCEDVVQGYTTETKCHKWPKIVCDPTEQDVTKYTPKIWCEKKERQIWVPTKCIPQPQTPVCHEEDETVITEKPTEECHLEPRKHCRFVTKLVPHLKPKENCVDVPKEVCAKSRTNPRREPRHVIKKWCYVPSPESGLPAAG